MAKEFLADNQVFTVPEVAKIIGTNVDYVYKLQKSGLLKFMKIGRWKVRKVTLEAFLEKWDGWDISDPFNPKQIDEQVS